MEDKLSSLLDYLWHNYECDVSASELSQYLKVSSRQIRKYISSLNNVFTDGVLIHSTNKGYKIDVKQFVKYKENINKQKIETPQTRQNYIVQRLISEKEGLNIYDLIDEIYVSESTIDNDLKIIRKITNRFNIQIIKNKEYLKLEGSEKSKRQLMGTIISSDSYDNFILKNEIKLLTYHYQFWDFRKDLLEIFTRNNIFVNDYTLNNTALHLIVMIDRIRNNCVLTDEDNLNSLINSPQYKVSEEIMHYIQSKYSVEINNSELYNLILIISNNTTIIDYSAINENNISQFIEQKYIDIAKEVMHSVEECYSLEAFSDDFICKFTIHVKNLFNRIENNYYTKNPLTSKIKATYPLIYDISVFIAQQFDDNYGITLNEDEIAFISFHVGSYFENTVQEKNKISVLFLYADYYSIHKKTLDKIKQYFEYSISIKYAISINSYKPNLIHADLIISTVDMPFSNPSVIVNPFLTEKDLSKIDRIVTRILMKKTKNTLKRDILNLFDQSLFYTNLRLNNRDDIIKKLCNNAIEKNFALDIFTEDVFAREKMSSTAFQNVAVPHAIGYNTNKSFISVALFPNELQWGNKKVQLVMLLGVDSDTRKLFSQIFDGLVEIVTEPICLNELIISKSYSEFITKLSHYMDNLN